METKNNNPEKVVESAATARVECSRILEMNFRRDNDALKIELKSTLDWKLFRRNNKETVNIGGVVCYRPRNTELEGVDSCFSMEASHEYNGFPNLTMLLAQDIQKGVTFNFPPMPIVESRVLNWLQKMKEDAKIMYLTYCKPVNVSVVITSETVEREIHH